MKTKKPKTAEKQQYSVPMRLTFRSHVTVEATDPVEARRIADESASDWIDDGMPGAELIDYQSTGNGRLR